MTSSEHLQSAVAIVSSSGNNKVVLVCFTVPFPNKYKSLRDIAVIHLATLIHRLGTQV